MTDNVVQFPARNGDPNLYRDPIFVIEVYRGDGNGFDWIVHSPDARSAPDTEELSSYLGDMFIALNPQPPGILDRLAAFLHQINPFRKGSQE